MGSWFSSFIKKKYKTKRPKTKNDFGELKIKYKNKKKKIRQNILKARHELQLQVSSETRAPHDESFSN